MTQLKRVRMEHFPLPQPEPGLSTRSSPAPLGPRPGTWPAALCGWCDSLVPNSSAHMTKGDSAVPASAPGSAGGQRQRQQRSQQCLAHDKTGSAASLCVIKGGQPQLVAASRPAQAGRDTGSPTLQCGRDNAELQERWGERTERLCLQKGEFPTASAHCAAPRDPSVDRTPTPAPGTGTLAEGAGAGGPWGLCPDGASCSLGGLSRKGETLGRRGLLPCSRTSVGEVLHAASAMGGGGVLGGQHRAQACPLWNQDVVGIPAEPPLAKLVRSAGIHRKGKEKETDGYGSGGGTPGLP